MMLVEKSFDIGEAVLNYAEGPDNGPPLLLIHGWGQSSEGWGNEVLSRLSSDQLIIIFDNRGTGRSSQTASITIDSMAEDTYHLLKHLGKTPAHVLGYSMGGMIAQQLSLSHPDAIRSLTLCCTSPGGPKSVLGKTLDDTEASELLEDISDVSFTQMWNLFYSFTQKKEDERLRALLDRLESWRTPARYSTNPTEPIVWYEQFKVITGYDSSSRLGEIHAPALVLLGELDDVFPPINSELLSEGIPNSRLVVFNDAGHLFLWEITEEVISTVLDFLESLR